MLLFVRYRLYQPVQSSAMKYLILLTNYLTSCVLSTCLHAFIITVNCRSADLLSLMALWGTASGATGLSLSTSWMSEHRTGSLCLSLYLGYRPSSTVHNSSYTLVCTWRLKEDRRQTLRWTSGVKIDLMLYDKMVRPASGRCKRKATVQFSQAAVVSVPPIRRSTVAMWTWTSVRSCRHEDM